MKRDGHTHTEYCPHGQVEDVELLIQQAIKLGFKEYSVTEHAPLPPVVIAQGGGPAQVFTTGGMALNDVTHYLNKVTALKQKYASDILLHVGFELDYFQHHEAWTKDFLNEHGSQTDDGLISVHFLDGVDGLRGIDFSYEDYRDGIVANFGSFQQAQTAYYEMVLRSLEADLGPYKPNRLGHISLCHKFKNAFAEETDFTPDSFVLIDELLQKTKERGYTLDLNTAGLFKENCLEVYPTERILQKAVTLDIPLIYGSDTHHYDDLNRGYETISHLV